MIMEQMQVSNMSMPLDKIIPVGKIGYSYANAHHGEIFQGVLVDSGNKLRRGLISLLCKGNLSKATFQPNETDEVSVSPGWKTKAQRAAVLTLDYISAPGRGGHLDIRSNIPLRWGLGSSTSDVTATIRAVADAFSVKLTAQVLGELAVKAETASDALMFGDRAVLFAHREGNVIEDFGGMLPPLEVLGFNTDPTGRGVDTLGYSPASYDWWEIEAFRPLIGMVRQAVQSQSPQLIGKVATASARINQRHLPKPCFDQLEYIAKEVRAVGIQVAHSGTVAGLLFDPNDPASATGTQRAKSLLDELGFPITWHFKTGNNRLV
jgi:uncharacterized protein involved in propanediol utilization